MSDWTSHETLNVGDIIAERFEVISVLAENAVGTTCIVEDREAKTKMLLERLNVRYEDGEEWENFDKNIKEVAQIKHKSIISLESLQKIGDDACFTLEFVDAEPLESHLSLRRQRGQILGLKTAYSLLVNICLGIECAHEAGRFYGALSPKNIFVTKQGRIKLSSLASFYVAQHDLPEDASIEFLNTPFTAPELLTDPGALTAAADIYSVALLTAELLSDTPLFDFTGDPSEFIQKLDISDTLKADLIRAIDDDPAKRFATIAEFREQLKQATDAPSDGDLSSIVMGISDIRALSISQELPPVKTENKQPDLFDRAKSSGSSKRISKDKEIWIVQKEDKLDYGPFSGARIIEMLNNDEIHERTPTLNMNTQKRLPLIEIEEFKEEVEKYRPIREQKRLEKAAAEERKSKRMKIGGALLALFVLLGIAAVIGISYIIYINLPRPEPLQLANAITVYPKTFEAPKVEQVALNVEAGKAKALFDPKASAEEREAALKAWEEEHRKKFASKRKAAGMGGNGEEEDEMATLSFLDGDGDEGSPLADWEIEDELSSARMMRKQSDCFFKYSGGRSLKVNVSFTIAQSGVVRSVKTTGAAGELDACLKDAFSSLHFRKFGGAVKKVTYPLNFN